MRLMTQSICLLLSFIILLFSESTSAQTVENSPLMQALLTADYAKMEELVKQGADVNQLVNGRTLLHSASDRMVNMTVTLRGMGITFSTPATKEQRERLHQALHVSPATSEMMVPLIKWLIAHGAKVDAEDSLGNTPLSTAAENGYQKNAEVLLENGANVNIPNKYGATPFYVALKTSPALAHLMLAKNPEITGGPLNSRTHYIHLAVQSGNIDLVKYVLAHGANLNEKDDQYRSPFEIALARNDQPMMEYLKSFTAQAPSPAPLAGSTLFEYVGSDYNVPKVEALLSQGADVNGKDARSGCSPLFGAINSFQREMSKLLLDHGADPNNACRDGRIPLDRAVGDEVLTTMLLDKGADINKIGEFGQTPLYRAVPDDRTGETIKFLISKGARLDILPDKGRELLNEIILSTVNAPNSASAIAKMNLLIGYGAMVTGSNAKGETLLHQACIYGLTDLAEFLISHGLPINAKDNEGIKPIHLAARSGKKELVQLLMAKGAKLEVGDTDKMIELATQMNHPDMISWIRDGMK